MRAYIKQDLSPVKDPVARTILQKMQDYLMDVSHSLGDSTESPTSSPAEDTGGVTNASYITVNSNSQLSAERRLSVSSPLSGSDGGANSTYTLSAPTVVTSAATLTDDAIVVGAGGSRGVETRGVLIDASNFRLRETGGEWIGMASTTAKTSQTSQTANTSEQTLHSEALLSGILDVAGRNLHVRAWGTMSYNSSMSPTTLTLAFKYGSTAVWSTDITFGTPAGSVLQHWCFLLDVITVSSGNARAFGMFIYGNVTGGAGGALGVEGSEIAVASAPTTSGAVSASLTHDWSVTDANMTMTCEMCSFELGGLTA